jgi:hypothetical protein
MRPTLLAFLTALWLIPGALDPKASHASSQVNPGYDLLITAAGTEFNFPGTCGLVSFQGAGIGSFDFGGGPVDVGMTDTIVRRLGTVTSDPDTIAIQIVALQLVSVAPVDCGFGPETLSVALVGTNPSTMTVSGTSSESSPHGTFDSDLNFVIDLIGSNSGLILNNEPKSFQASGVEWSHNPPTGIPLIPSVNFQLNGFNSAADFFPEEVFQEDAGGQGKHVTRGVPTLSEWGTILFGLLLTAGAMRFLSTRRLTLAAAGDSTGQIRTPGFDSALYVKILAVTLLLAAAIVVAAGLLVAAPSTLDLIGSVLAASIVAYIVHLWLLQPGE